MTKKMTFIGDEEREIPGYGVFKPGDVVDFNKSLHESGLFDVIEKKSKEKDGDK
ncbi:hypothetical protein [Effusibacillus consociatus]|uniref:Phage protein n=1 Tax=Effusibacillus consociatus TaxID=1117041 RepID=A0ABV9Q3I2_9BACL